MRGWIRRLLVPVAAAVMLAAPGTLPAAAADGTAEQDVRTAIEHVPGLTVLEERPAAPGLRFFVLQLRQPIDHRHPEAGTFQQRITLLHKAVDRPTVLWTGGYQVPLDPARSEPATLLDGNQLNVEQRFFGTSVPSATDYRTLTIEQAADDHHRVVEAFRSVYRGRWISAGGSKGGMATVYHRRFHPGDVDGSIAYSAPDNVDDREDSAYLDFLATAGTPECRAALRTVQREALLRRDELVARYADRAARDGTGFTVIGSADKAFEIAVLRLPFTFWQSGGQAACPTVPGTGTPTDDLDRWIDRTGRLTVYTDRVARDFIPYFYQLGTQMGYFDVETAHLADLLRYPGATEPRSFVPRDIPMRHQPGAMRDIDRWVRTAGTRLLFLNGRLDPSVAEPFRLGPGSRDSYVLWDPDAAHATRIGELPDAERAVATATLMRWAGLD
ncbi:S28 family serine protease [Kitasatospora camelliae]|uniref:S28 family serine protease n=1 Tax=Kitasatospora camelliae TaxID=3156397 RepID=A0AAU8JUG3_9ACTN